MHNFSQYLEPKFKSHDMPFYAYITVCLKYRQDAEQNISK